MTTMIVAFEAVPFWKAAVYMAGGTIIIFTVLGIGAYFFLRALAQLINGRRDSWTNTAASLGLSVDDSKGGMLKMLKGKRGEHIVTVEPFSVQTGKYSSDSYAAVEVQFLDPLDFTLNISKTEMLYQKVAGLFDNSQTEIGFDAFDKAFAIDCSQIRSLQQLLHKEMLDGESPTLLTDLMLANKRYHRVRLTDRSICLGVRAELNDPEKIGATIEKAIYIANRVARASRQITERTSS